MVSSSIVKGGKQQRVRLNRPTNQEVPIFVQNTLKDLAAFLETEFILSIEASCNFQFGFNLTSATNQAKISKLFPGYFEENILQVNGLVRRERHVMNGTRTWRMKAVSVFTTFGTRRKNPQIWLFFRRSSFLLCFSREIGGQVKRCSILFFVPHLSEIYTVGVSSRM